MQTTKWRSIGVMLTLWGTAAGIVFLANPSVVDVSKTNFGQTARSSVNPRLIQFALKYVF